MGFKLNISKGHCLMVLILMYCPKYLVTSFLKLFRTIIISGKHAKGTVVLAKLTYSGILDHLFRYFAKKRLATQRLNKSGHKTENRGTLKYYINPEGVREIYFNSIKLPLFDTYKKGGQEIQRCNIKIIRICLVF